MFWDLSPYARGRSLYKFLESFSYGFIPVRTGQILKNSKNYVPIDSSPYARGGRTGKTQIAARDRFIPAHTGQTLNPPRKPLRLRSSCSHLKIPWQSQYVSSFWNAFLRITHFGHFRCFFCKKEMPAAPLSQFVFLIIKFCSICTLPGFCILPMSCLFPCSNTIPYKLRKMKIQIVQQIWRPTFRLQAKNLLWLFRTWIYFLNRYQFVPLKTSL